MTKFRIVTWREIDQLAQNLYHLVKNDDYRPEIILGISRGGTIPARLLSDMFEAGFPFKNEKTTFILATMQVKFYTGISETHTQPMIEQDVTTPIYFKKILLVDDLADTGASLQCALDYISSKSPKEVKIATFLCKPWSKIIPHYFVEETTKWVVFPHEYYEFMTERTISEGYDKAEAWATFVKLGIPDSSVSFFVENFLS